MGERKVLNKYIPADFDPQLVPRSKKPKDNLVTVRMMLPFTIQCASCSSFLYRGRKFNSKKENVKGVNGKYLGIQRFRFYIKCTDCSRPITFLTDPKNTDYEMESGGTRNYEVWHDEKKTNAAFEQQAEEDEKLDSMRALENRVAESQREMAELDALEEIRAMNQRHVKLMKGGGRMNAAERVLQAREEAMGVPPEEEDLNEDGLTREEEELVRSIKFGAAAREGGAGADDDDNGGDGGGSLRRLDEEDEAREDQRRAEAAAAAARARPAAVAKRAGAAAVPAFKVKRRRRKEAAAGPPATAKGRTKQQENEGSADEESSGGALGGLLCYGTDSD